MGGFGCSRLIDVQGGSPSLVAGGRSARTGDDAYTFVHYVEIEPTD